MPNGYGFGFRGVSPPWPYVGRGRGGLPRCWYPGAVGASTYWPGPGSYPFYGGAWGPSYYGSASVPGTMPYPPPMTQEQEVSFLKEQAGAMKGQLDEIEARLKELSVGEE